MTSGDKELGPRELAILRHVALYRLTLTLAVERLFFTEGGNAGTILAKLASKEYLRYHKTIADGAFSGHRGALPNFTLAPKGAALLRMTEGRDKELGDRAIPNHLATLWFCCLSDRRRYRLEPAESDALFGRGSLHPNIPCCLAEEETGPRAYRVYQPSTGVSRAIKQLREVIEELWAKPSVRPWLETGDLGFALLAETERKCADLVKKLKAVRKDEPSIADECHVIVRFAPSPSTVGAAVAAIRKASK